VTIAELHAGALRLADERQPEVVRRVLKRLLAPQPKPDPQPTSWDGPAPILMADYREMMLRVRRARQMLFHLREQMQDDDEDGNDEFITQNIKVREQTVVVENLLKKAKAMDSSLRRYGVTESDLILVRAQAYKDADAMQEAPKKSKPVHHYIGHTATSSAVTIKCLNSYYA